MAGVAVGSVKSIDVTQDGHAEVKFTRQTATTRRCGSGTQAMIKQALAVRHRQPLRRPPARPANGAEIPDGGTIGPDQTATAVELDQIFNLFDTRTRRALQDFIKGSATMLHGQGQAAAPRRPLPEPGAVAPAPACSRSSPATTRCWSASSSTPGRS